VYSRTTATEDQAAARLKKPAAEASAGPASGAPAAGARVRTRLAGGPSALAGSTPDLASGQPGLAIHEPEAIGEQGAIGEHGSSLEQGAFREQGLVAEAGRLALSWAAGRHLSRSTACGITLALTACAAAWFSSGSRTDIVRGVAALWIGYLVLKGGRLLPAVRTSAVRVGWLTALGSCLAECVVYAGLTEGAAAGRWSRAWPLGIAVLGLVGVRNLMSVCSVAPGFGEHPDGAIRRICADTLTMPLGGRVLLIGVVAPAWGARATLLALLDWAIVSIGYGLAGRAARGLTDDDAERPSARSSLLLRLRDDGALARGIGSLVRGNLLPLPPAVLGLVAISALGLLGLHGLPRALMIGPAVVMLLAAPGSAHPHTGRLDWLVPVLLVGAQILYLTATGLGVGVPGPVIFALAATLLLRYADLAFPGRPVMLTRAQPPDGERREWGTAVGWEGRLLIAGLAAAVGIATFAYLALTVYFGFLIGAKVVTSSVARREELNRDRLGDGSRG